MSDDNKNNHNVKVDPVEAQAEGTTPPGPGDAPSGRNAEKGFDPIAPGEEEKKVKILKEGELTKEDAALKEMLEEAVRQITGLPNLERPELLTVKNPAAGLATLKRELQSSTASLTAIPKPLKFLRPHLDSLVKCYVDDYDGRQPQRGREGVELADILSILCMTMPSARREKENECLRWKLLGNVKDLVGWGHEYVRAISADATREYQIVTAPEGEMEWEAEAEEEEEEETKRAEQAEEEKMIDVVTRGGEGGKDGKNGSSSEGDKSSSSKSKEIPIPSVPLPIWIPPRATLAQLEAVISDVAPFHMKQGVEAEAVDMLFETGKFREILPLVDGTNASRVALYLTRLADYVPDAKESAEITKIAMDVYMRAGEDLPTRYCDALRLALRLNDRETVIATMKSARDEPLATRKQMAVMLASARAFWYEEEEDADLAEVVANTNQSEMFLYLARELNVEEAKTPEDVYKSHLAETGGFRHEAPGTGAQVESARQNLASTFVNAYVNCGFVKDALVTPEGNAWIFKNKDHAMISATASLGMVVLWNVDEGMTQIDKFLYSTDKNVKAGALLALGLCSCGIRDPVEPALGMLPGHLDATVPPDERSCAALGLGLAYAGNPKPEVGEALTPVVAMETPEAFESSCIAALALGFAYVGTADEEVALSLMTKLMETTVGDLNKPIARLVALAIALVFMGKQEDAEAALQVISTIEHPISKFTSVLVEACAYADSGNVSQIQKLLHLCAESAKAPIAPSSDDAGTTAGTGGEGAGGGAERETAAGEGGDGTAPPPDPLAGAHQSIAVIGIALISMGESIGREMVERTYQHLLQYGNVYVRRAVPLALAMTHASHPDFTVVDTLSRLTHDADTDTAMSAILALGLVGCGTNNSRIAGLLRLLSSFYSKEPNQLFVVRLAQGYLHAGKGLVTVHPYHSDRSLLLKPALAGLLTLATCALDLKSTLLGRLHYLNYCLAPAIRPRHVAVVDTDLRPIVPGVQVRIGAAVDVVGMAGKPKTITGFQTHASPALLSVGERAEFAEAGAWISPTRVLEGLVIAEKAPEQPTGGVVGSSTPAGGPVKVVGPGKTGDPMRLE